MADDDLPDGWEIRYSRSNNGKPYYFKAATKESQWEKPAGPPANKVRCSHLLVKHRESRRPASWRDDKITRTKDEALQIIKGYRARIVSGQVDFGDLASTESDCSSAKNKGDLGIFGRNQMQKPFEDVSFRLEVGEMSDPVFTDSGIHLILRTA
ncbi:peptidyl-prolyl cis-trans isomerase NIMA-interacting 1-like isoform X1 [Lytechinus variegatus]|uniref:peptidyl-prolyl cis-trans isomerase NIMA-interacting 1-like isoform X1 n=1 Tax=Lytechinus variegatus TaxID=7654 RepID=UPI001BB2372D|nr:peptidyl-prolyl cis-trans isomerase NIMA-interacting 1-like isoform X1 [Lytechinus variegatus]